MGCQFLEKAQLTDLELAAMLISASCHDLQHFGVNNQFLIESKHDFALRYNDESVLENHHVATAFKFINEEDTAIFERLSIEDYKDMRKKMISMVLATDMGKHMQDAVNFKNRLAAEDFAPDGEDKLMCMGQVVHMADLNNPTKPWQVSYNWTGILYIEFFDQGDKEKELGLPIGMLMDRDTVNIAEKTLGFVSFVIKPAYESFAEFLPGAQLNLDTMEDNKSQWEQCAPIFQDRMD